jgi:hypothetical protein
MAASDSKVVVVVGVGVVVVVNVEVVVGVGIGVGVVVGVNVEVVVAVASEIDRGRCHIEHPHQDDIPPEIRTAAEMVDSMVQVPMPIDIRGTSGLMVMPPVVVPGEVPIVVPLLGTVAGFQPIPPGALA